MKYRKEKDTMGTVMVPQTAYYGPQTQRAVDNFPIGHLTIPASFIHSLALLKKCAARINKDLGLLDAKLADAIEAAAQQAHITEFTDRLSDGLDTLIGENGIRLSAGQRQRITWDLLDRRDPATGIHSMARTTGYTATVTARLIARGLFDQSGIIPPERIRYLSEIADTVRAYHKRTRKEADRLRDLLLKADHAGHRYRFTRIDDWRTRYGAVRSWLDSAGAGSWLAEGEPPLSPT